MRMQTCRRMLGLFVGLLALIVVTGPGWAQSGNQGVLTVTVQDRTGGVVPAARLLLRDHATNDVREADSLASGTYSFPALNAGSYTLICLLCGWSQTRQIFVTVLLHQDTHGRDGGRRYNGLLILGFVQQFNTLSKVQPECLLRVEFCHRETLLMHDALHPVAPLPHVPTFRPFGTPANAPTLVYLAHGLRFSNPFVQCLEPYIGLWEF